MQDADLPRGRAAYNRYLSLDTPFGDLGAGTRAAGDGKERVRTLSEGATDLPDSAPTSKESVNLLSESIQE